MEGLPTQVIQRSFVRLLLGLLFLQEHVKRTSVSVKSTSPGFAGPPSGTDCPQGVSVFRSATIEQALTRIPPLGLDSPPSAVPAWPN